MADAGVGFLVSFLADSFELLWSRDDGEHPISDEKGLLERADVEVPR